LPGSAKDTDELIKENPALWTKAIEAAEPAVEWVIARYSERENSKTAEGKRRFSTAALAVTKSLSDHVEQEHYQQVIADMTGSSLETIKAKQSASGTDTSKRLKPVATGTQPAAQITYSHIDTAFGAA